MKHQPFRSLKIATVLGALCLFFPVLIIGLWIHAFNLGTTQTERVEIFTNYFPGFLHGRFTHTLVSMAFCILSIVLCRMGMKLPEKSWRALNSFSLVLAALILLMNLFEMM